MAMANSNRPERRNSALNTLTPFAPDLAARSRVASHASLSFTLMRM